MCRTCPGRARWGTCNGGVACATTSFHRKIRVYGICSSTHREVCRGETALRSPDSCTLGGIGFEQRNYCTMSCHYFLPVTVLSRSSLTPIDGESTVPTFQAPRGEAS